MAAIFTNMGGKSRKASPRLNPLGQSTERHSAPPSRADSPDGYDSSSQNDMSRSGLLPPLGRSAGQPSRAVELMDGPANDSPDGQSPTRRSRKQHLLNHGDTYHKTLIQATIELDQKEREMSLVRDGRREAGRALLEMWVDQVLDPRTGSDSLVMRAEAMKMDASSLRGLATYGLTRAELQNAGLPDGAIDRLYRGMYVYTVGFFDIMQDMLQHTGFRAEVLANVWKGFLSIAESALSVGFKSDYLLLFQQQKLASAELMVAKEALAEARQDSSNTDKAISWLTAAHAEERALRQSMKLQLEAHMENLDRERRAHSAAVTKYTQEMEARAGLQLEVDAAALKMAEAAAAQVALVLQRDALQGYVNTLDERLNAVHGTMEEIIGALSMEPTLVLPGEVQSGLVVEKGGSRLDNIKVQAVAVRIYSQQLYSAWNTEAFERKACATQLYDCKDDLRLVRQDLYSTQHSLNDANNNISGLEFRLGEAAVEASVQANVLADCQAQLATVQQLKADGDQKIARLNTVKADLEAQLVAVSTQRSKLQAHGDKIERVLSNKVEECDEAWAESRRIWGLLQEVSKGFAVTMASLSANQTARKLLQTNMVEAGRVANEARAAINEANRIQNVMNSRIEQLTLHLAETAHELEVMTDSHALGESVLAESLVEIDRRKQEIGRLQGKLAEAARDMDRVEKELTSETIRAVAAEDADRTARDENARLATVIRELDTGMAAAAEDRVRLMKKVERLVNERRAADDRGEEKLKLLSAEVERRDVQLSANTKTVELLGLEVELQRKKITDETDALQRKRIKKQKWKAQFSETNKDMEHLRKLIEEKDAALAVMASRIQPLEVDLAILVADRGRNLAATSNRPLEERDMQKEYKRHDAAWETMQALQTQLVEQNRGLDEARKDYEKARAQFYKHPDDADLRALMSGKEANVATHRSGRTSVEEKIKQQAVELRKVTDILQTFEAGQNKRRLAVLTQRMNNGDISMRSELSARVDDAETRSRQLAQRLSVVMKQCEDLQNTADTWMRDSKKVEGELNNVGNQLTILTTTNVELTTQVNQYKTMISYMQGESASVTKERDKLGQLLSNSDARTSRLKEELEAAGHAASIMIKRVEEHFADDRRQFEVAASDARQKHVDMVAYCDSEIKSLQGTRKQLEEKLCALLAAYFKEVEHRDGPHYLFQLQPTIGVLAIGAAVVKMGVPNASIKMGVDMTDALAQHLAPSYEILLTVISQIYLDKILSDCKAEENLLRNVPGHRNSLEHVLYDFFMSRCGTRPATELHISAFLCAVMTCREQHPKVKTFARLLGCPPTRAEPPLPPGASDFYFALLNRVHARAGPLVGEAVEGYSVIKCKYVAKAARDMLKGPYSNLVDEAASLPDNLRAMAGNDEDGVIDLEMAMDLSLQAYVVQYKSDLDTVASLYRHAMAGMGRTQITPDEFFSFLRQLNTLACEELDPTKLVNMYRHAQRMAGGPQADGLPSALCQAVVQSGFVGISTHLGRLEVVKATAVPPYDEFRLLEECWKNMRQVVAAQITIMTSHRTEFHNVDVVGYQDLCRKLELTLEHHSEPGAAWVLYRRVLLIFTQHKPKADIIQPFAKAGEPAKVDAPEAPGAPGSAPLPKGLRGMMPSPANAYLPVVGVSRLLAGPNTANSPNHTPAVNIPVFQGGPKPGTPRGVGGHAAAGGGILSASSSPQPTARAVDANGGGKSPPGRALLGPK